MFAQLHSLSTVLVSTLALAAPGVAPVAGVPVGCFARLEGMALEEVKGAGFEFVEVGLRNVVALSDPEFEGLLARVKGLGLPVRAAINFLPPELKVVGPTVDTAAQQAYLARAFGRAERLGLKVIVFGSGKARSFPDGFAAKQAFGQLVDFGRRAAREARKHKLSIGIEPLGADEANTINTVAEAVALARAVGHPAFGLTVDYYHLTLAKEPPSVLRQARNLLHHVRIANPNGRAFPQDPAESDYAAFFAVLAQIGYRGAIGIEARTGTAAQNGPTAIAVLRTLAAPLGARAR